MVGLDPTIKWLKRLDFIYAAPNKLTINYCGVKLASMNTDILIVEDESAIRSMITIALRQAGFECRLAADIRQAQQHIAHKTPDLIVLDWMLPGISGLEFARRLRRDPQTQTLPIIMLTARGELEDKIKGLDSGADDYVTKPFSPQELIARIRSLLRRSAPQTSEEMLEIAGLRLDPVTHRVTGNGTELELGPTEFRLLHFFMANPERVFSRNQILDKIWGSGVYIEDRTIDVHIGRLRKALANSGHDQLIQTVRNIGYRFSSVTT